MAFPPEQFLLVLLRGALVGAAVAAAFLLAPLLVPLVRETRPLPAGVRDDVARVCRRQDVSPDRVCVVRSDEVDAAAVGLPPTERVFLTEGAIDRCTDVELRALVAHELAHLSERHLWARCSLTVLCAAVWVPVVTVLGPTGDAVGLASVAAPAAGLVVLLGRLGVTQEFASDDRAVRLVGPEATVAVLRRLAATEPNPASAKLTAALGLRPSLARRVARVRGE